MAFVAMPRATEHDRAWGPITLTRLALHAAIRCVRHAFRGETGSYGGVEFSSTRLAGEVTWPTAWPRTRSVGSHRSQGLRALARLDIPDLREDE